MTVALARNSAGVSVAARVPRRGLRPPLLLYLALTLTPSLPLETLVLHRPKKPLSINNFLIGSSERRRPLSRANQGST